MGKKAGKRGQKIVRKLSSYSKKAGKSGYKHVRRHLIDRFGHIKDVRLLVLEWALLILAITMLSITQSIWYAESYSVSSWGEGGTYTEATLGKINSLNPLFASTNSEKVLSKLMFATLSAPDYSGHIGLNLASSITADDTGNNWRVKLKDGSKWSDGEPITNEDVIYTVSVLQSPNVNTQYSSNMSNIKVSEEKGELVFKLPAAYANFPSALDFPILPAHVLRDVKPELLLEDSFSISSPVTSGPFTYNATQAVGSSGEKIVYLNPNESYYDGKPMLGSFAIHAFATEDDLKNAMKSGSVTATAELSPTSASEIPDDVFQERQTAISSGVYAFFNTTGNIFSNAKLRKAVQVGLDFRSLRAPIGEELALDYPLLKSQTTIPDKDYPKLPEYDPKSAKDTIAAAGIGDQPVKIATVRSGYLPDVAENLKYQLENLGFKVELNVFDPNQEFLLTVIRPREYDILIHEVELGADPDLFAYYHSSQATPSGLNLSNYNNALASDLILAARGTMDQDVRNAKYAAFLKLWVDEVPAIGIYQANMTYFVNKNVRSFSGDNHLITALDRFEDISSWATERATKNRTP